MKEKHDFKKMPYEEAVKRLEEIVRFLESEEVPLEESLQYFQEGIALSKYCREKLTEIEFRVEYLLKEEQKTLGDNEQPDCENLLDKGDL